MPTPTSAPATWLAVADLPDIAGARALVRLDEGVDVYATVIKTGRAWTEENTGDVIDAAEIVEFHPLPTAADWNRAERDGAAC